ncbi:MAG: exopolyphosphatase [Planctomycetes bacterium]|nr:exopolyphosphatase [Planctomycetota bacterium]
MVVARRVDNELRLVDRMRERVQLAAGLDANQELTAEAQERALLCLGRMGQRLRDLAPDKVRAVGTNTLRKAKNAPEFLKRAREALGHPIEIIAGLEEARLIYLGVSHFLADEETRRLVIDIGGGSTECIVGEGSQVLEADSLHMGCVSYSLRFFPDGELRRKHLRAAELAARLELRTLERRFRSLGWDVAYGASGTVHAISNVLRQNEWTEGEITPNGLRQLRKAILAAGHRDQLSLPGLKSERAAVLAGGVAILQALFESLGIKELRTSKTALREGVLLDLDGRGAQKEVREQTIRRLMVQYRIDLDQADRVERTATYLLQRVAEAWDLGDSEAKRLLRWAARLHEVGLVINYSSYHKHGAYLLENAHMAGFSNDARTRLAALVRLHRRKLTGSDLASYTILNKPRYLRLGVLLRLAVLLNRGRSPRPLPYFGVEASPEGVTFDFPPEWLEEHPLTVEDLRVERGLLEARGVTLQVSPNSE